MTGAEEELPQWALDLARKHVGAFNLLLEDGLPVATAAQFIVAAANNGQNTTEMAKHVLALRKAARAEGVIPPATG